MTSFFAKLFGNKKIENAPEELVRLTLQTLFEKAQFDLSFDISGEKLNEDENQISIDIFGPDEDLIKSRDGQMIDAVQLFLKRVLQHHFPEDRSQIAIDCGGFREETQAQLIDMAEKLKSQALEKGKSVYFRALPPRDRKVIHQYLAGDDRVKSRSIGDGVFKKIKIFPTKATAEANND